MWESLTVFFVDDKNIVPINIAAFGKDTPTDVISLRYSPLPGSDCHSGEIFVNLEKALTFTVSAKTWNLQKETALYIAHGCDHLMDEDDSTAEQSRRMRNRELKWIREAASKMLLKKLFY